MKTMIRLLTILAVGMALESIGVEASPDNRLVELPSPNSGTFTFEQAEERKLEILNNAPSGMLRDISNPKLDFGIHIEADQSITIYSHSMLEITTGVKGPHRNQTVKQVKEAITSIPVFSRVVNILVTSNQPLKESKKVLEVLDVIFEPGIQIYYVKRRTRSDVKGKKIAVSIHYSNGLSTTSEWKKTPEINLFKQHTHIHLKITNSSGEPVTLWRPYCPEGDSAMVIEFRDVNNLEKVYHGRTCFSYTGGMGIPKTFDLMSGDDLIVNVDFLNEWRFSISMEHGTVKEMEVRAIYRSKPLTQRQRKKLTEVNSDLKEVAAVLSESKWERVRIINNSGRKLGPIAKVP